VHDPLGAEAADIGLVSMAVDDDFVQQKALEIASTLADGPPTAIRLTKYTMNHWLRMAGPIFDASLAFEFHAFTGPELKEGLASIREKRPAKFRRTAPSRTGRASRHSLRILAWQPA
jgi:enoyl-CoA hydratase